MLLVTMFINNTMGNQYRLSLSLLHMILTLLIECCSAL